MGSGLNETLWLGKVLIYKCSLNFLQALLGWRLSLIPILIDDGKIRTNSEQR